MNVLEQHIVEQIREHSLRSEQGRSFSREALQSIIEQGWFKLFVPKEFGGRMADLPSALKIFEYASWVDGNFGWIVTIGAGGGYFAAYLEPETAEALFSSPEAVIAGSGAPSGKARRVEGGYIVNGQWSYCSGSGHATLFTGNAIVEDSDANEVSHSEHPHIRAFAFMPDQVEIVEDWSGFGLKMTESHSIVVRDQFVPEERTFSLFEQRAFLNERLFDYPFLQFAQASFAVVGMGISRHLLDEAKSLAARQQSAWDAGKAGRTAYVMSLIERSEAKLNAEAREFYEAVERSWQAHVQGERLADDELDRISRQCKQASRTALSCGQAIFPYLGMSAIMESERINQIWRDLQTACQHSLIVPFE